MNSVETGAIRRAILGKCRLGRAPARVTPGLRSLGDSGLCGYRRFWRRFGYHVAGAGGDGLPVLAKHYGKVRLSVYHPHATGSMRQWTAPGIGYSYTRESATRINGAMSCPPVFAVLRAPRQQA